jgi:SAM-dependent methyltransferase
VGITQPTPTEAELTRAYDTWYRPDDGRFSGPGDGFLRWGRGLLARRLDRIAPPGPVLDVGSGDGALLAALRARGREAEGVERGSTPAATFGDLAEVPGEWAAVVFWHSLEHLPAPAAALERAAELLLPGGVVVIAVPNAGSIQARAFGDDWLALDLPRHLVHLPAAALMRRLEALDLRVTRVSWLRGGQVAFGWLHGLVGLLPGHPHLYDAIRRPDARSSAQPPARRACTLAAAAALAPVAAVLAGLEAALGRAGTVYVEAVNG